MFRLIDAKVQRGGTKKKFSATAASAQVTE
jgi:hypothetical protein